MIDFLGLEGRSNVKTVNVTSIFLKLVKVVDFLLCKYHYNF